MNSNRKIVVVATLGIVALGVTTGWSVLAGAAWPPEPYQEFSPAGSWTDLSSGGSVAALTPPDPRTGTGSGIEVLNEADPTSGGLIPEATSQSPWFYTYVRTGPNTYRIKGIMYTKEDSKPKPTILSIHVFEATATQTAPDLMDYTGAVSVYSPAADKDGDDVPDADEAPIRVWSSVTGTKKRL
jgi:hypothetical protein